MRKIFYKQSKIANRKRTKEKIKSRQKNFMIWLFKTPRIAIKDRVTKSGKSYTVFFY